MKVLNHPPPQAQPAPRVVKPSPRVERPSPRVQPSVEPVASRTRSQAPAPAPIASRTRSKIFANIVTPAKAASRQYPSMFIAQTLQHPAFLQSANTPSADVTVPWWLSSSSTGEDREYTLEIDVPVQDVDGVACFVGDDGVAMPVIDDETGESLEYKQLRKRAKYADIWNESFSNGLGRLCQGIGKGNKGPKNQRVEGTNTFFPISYNDIPKDRRKEITYTKVVCMF